MSTLSLKARREENFKNRHYEFLRAAIARMRTDGLTAVNLTDLSADSEFSKGTWYNHFKSAEALYVEIAVVNAELQHDYIADIAQDESLDSGMKLASVFICNVAHAITHPEIWTLGINARIWDKKSQASVYDAVERLTHWERENYDFIMSFAAAAQLNRGRSAEQITEALDIVRAAADGLGVLTATRAEHRWTREVTTQQTGTLLTSALTTAGFRAPTQPEMDRLCSQSWERISRFSDDWLVPRD